MDLKTFNCCASLALLCLVAHTASLETKVDVSSSPLFQYVNAPDPAFSYSINDTKSVLGYTMYSIHLVSQQWLNDTETRPSIWTHWLNVCVPDNPLPNNSLGFLYINGGAIHPSPPPYDSFVQVICEATGAVSAELHEIPNQPVEFESSSETYSEDALIAYTWAHYINNTDNPTWLARLPMTKAAVKALDALQAVTSSAQFKQAHPGVLPLESFVVGGASKRGWTTWTTGIVDQPRVVAIVPIVIPILNMVPNINHQWRVLGNWSFALDDYVRAGVIHYINSQQMTDLANVVDPFAYLSLLELPKFVIVATGDEFFPPDSTQFFFSELPGTKLLRVVPDAEHSLSGHQLDVVSSIQTFFWCVIHNTTLPQVTWDIAYSNNNNTATLTAVWTSHVLPRKIVMWKATNPNSRDFRLLTCANPDNPHCLNLVLWFESELSSNNQTSVTVSLDAPKTGFTGFFLELEFDLGGLSVIDPLKLTTEVAIVPNVLPFPPCTTQC